jgi:hypothetical protein
MLRVTSQHEPYFLNAILTYALRFASSGDFSITLSIMPKHKIMRDV